MGVGLGVRERIGTMHTPAEGSAMLARSTRILVVLMVAVLLGACHEQGLIRHHRKRGKYSKVEKIRH